MNILLFILRVKALPLYFRDAKTPLSKKAIIIFTLIASLIMLFTIPVFGFFLAIILWVAVINKTVLGYDLDRYNSVGNVNSKDGEDSFSKKYRDKDIVKGVEFTVKEDNTED